jgi:small Trp-rich protein
MYSLGLGLVLLLLKYLEIGPVGRLDWLEHWYIFAGPFILTFAWWTYADWSGYSKKKAMQKMDLRAKDRLNKNREALGLGTKPTKVAKKR